MQSGFSSPALHRAKPASTTLKSEEPSLFSQQQAEDLASQLFHEAQQQVNELKSKKKAKSLVSLPNLSTNKLIDPQDILRKRYRAQKKKVENEIKMLEKKCDKFGGSDHIHSQMNLQSLSIEEKAEYFRKRIVSIHGSLSLPRIAHVRGMRQEDNVKIHEQMMEKAKSKGSLREVNQYNKWYIRPKSRFTHQPDRSPSSKPTSINKYIDEVMAKTEPKREMKKTDEMNSLIKNSLLKLGREPLVSRKIKHNF